MTERAQRLRDAIQAVMDEIDLSEGYHVTQFVIAMGLERMRGDGTIEATCWYWAPPEQPDWQNYGLLEAAIEIRSGADDEDI